MELKPTELWDGRQVWCRGHSGGLPVFRYGGAPAGLATRRQLRAQGLAPGRQDPVAVLRFAHRRPGRRLEEAALYRVDLAAPSRPATPAQRAALDRAMTARRTCTDCQRDVGYCVPTSTRQCWDCLADEIDAERVDDDSDSLNARRDEPEAGRSALASDDPPPAPPPRPPQLPAVTPATETPRPLAATPATGQETAMADRTWTPAGNVDPTTLPMPAVMLDGVEERVTRPARRDDPVEIAARVAELRARIAPASADDLSSAAAVERAHAACAEAVQSDRTAVEVEDMTGARAVTVGDDLDLTDPGDVDEDANTTARGW